MAGQLVKYYFMFSGLGIVFSICSYLHFLWCCFFRDFYMQFYRIKIISKRISLTHRCVPSSDYHSKSGFHCNYSFFKSHSHLPIIIISLITLINNQVFRFNSNNYKLYGCKYSYLIQIFLNGSIWPIDGTQTGTNTVGLGVMAMKEYSTLLRSLKLELYYQIQFSIISGTPPSSGEVLALCSGHIQTAYSKPHR